MTELVWDGTALVPGAGAGELLAADSWLVDDGRVRGAEEHRRRFAAACAGAAGVPGPETAAFLDAAFDRLPVTGRWFPRVECGPGPRLHLRVRPAPPVEDTVVLGPYAGPDPRRSPRVKGPDLERLAGVRAAVAGAGEALLRDGDGTVLEGAYSAVVWWDGDVLCRPDPSLPVLDSVTLRLLGALAERHGTPVRPARARLDDLDGREVWCLSALHGLRPVTGWAGCGLRAGPAERAPLWRERLAGLAAPLPSPR